jgi:hypothetical protein
MNEVSNVSVMTNLGYVRALSSWGVIDKGNELPVLKAVALFQDGDNVTAVATNRYSIVQHKTVIGSLIGSIVREPDYDALILIPFVLLAQFVKAAAANKNPEMPVTIRISDDSVEIQMYEILVRGANIRGQYPRVDKFMDEKEPAKNTVRTFGFPSKQIVYLPKLIAPGSISKPVDYDYQATFTDSSSLDKAGPIVFTISSDPNFMVVVQPLMNANAHSWKGATNG